MPQKGIHGRSSTNCIPAAGWKVHHSGTEITNSARLAARATCFAQRSGTSSTTAAATTGQTRSAVSTVCEYMLAHHCAHYGDHADHEQHHVHTHLSRLQPAPHPSHGARRGRRPVHEQSVHHPHVHDLPQHLARQPHHRPDDDGVVQLIDVPLLPEQPTQP